MLRAPIAPIVTNAIKRIRPCSWLRARRPGEIFTQYSALRFASLLRQAKQQPQKVSLTVYVNDQRAVLTGFSETHATADSLMEQYG